MSIQASRPRRASVAAADAAGRWFGASERRMDGRGRDGVANRARTPHMCGKERRRVVGSRVVVAIPKKAAKKVSCHNTVGLDCRR